MLLFLGTSMIFILHSVSAAIDAALAVVLLRIALLTDAYTRITTLKICVHPLRLLPDSGLTRPKTPIDKQQTGSYDGIPAAESPISTSCLDSAAVCCSFVKGE
jgi:hypothetical protein